MLITREQELHRWTIGGHDFEDVLSFLERCSAYPVHSEERRALVMASVILYARPFSQNERRSSKKSKAEDAPKAISRLRVEWFKDLTDDELRLHTRIIDLRNKVVAHAEFNEYPTSYDPRTGVTWSRRAQPLDLGLNLSHVAELTRKVWRYCQHRRADHIIEKRDARDREVAG